VITPHSHIIRPILFFPTLVSRVLRCGQLRRTSKCVVTLSTFATHVTDHYIIYTSQSCTFTATFFVHPSFNLSAYLHAFTGIFFSQMSPYIRRVFVVLWGVLVRTRHPLPFVTRFYQLIIGVIARWHIDRQRLNKYRDIQYN